MVRAPAWFQYIVNETIRGVGDTETYIDDIQVGGDEWRACWRRTLQCLVKLVNAGFRINLRKCCFLVNVFIILGYEVATEQGQGTV